MSYICMVVDANYPQDIRVRKEAEALAKSDKNVLVVCPHKKGMAKKEKINGVDVLRIGANYTHSKKGIYDIIESVININPLFYRGLKQVFKEYSIDFLHIHDLPLAGTGYAFRKKVKRKLILDLHENFPEALKTWFAWKKSWLIRAKNTVFMNPVVWSRKERKYCEKYDKIICVVDEMKEKLIANFGVNKQKLVVISNFEVTSFSKVFDEKMGQSSMLSDVFSITYVGGFGPHRGLDTAIKAMPIILKEIPNAKLVLVGKGSVDVEAHLKEVVQKTNVGYSVLFLGYKPFNEVSAIMKSSNLNIIPHKENEHTNNTIPHKLFQIMMSKSMLLVSSCKPLKRVVTTYDAGLVFKADDEYDFAKKVIYAYTNYDNLKYKTENAYKAVMQSENWDKESKKLIDLYNNL